MDIDHLTVAHARTATASILFSGKNISICHTHGDQVNIFRRVLCLLEKKREEITYLLFVLRIFENVQTPGTDLRKSALDFIRKMRRDNYNHLVSSKNTNIL